MALPLRSRSSRPWLPWAKVGLAMLLIAGAGWGALELGQRYLGLQKLTIDRVSVSGCAGDRQAEIQALADRTCLGKPLFWFDAEGLRAQVEARRWVKGLLIRRDPPDRLSLVIEERKPLLWLVRPSGTYLLADDGTLMDRVNPGNLMPIPVVADPQSQTDEAVLQLVRTASVLRDRQPQFYERVTELRWTPRGAMAWFESLQAPLLLSRKDPALNIPNFQALYLSQYAKGPSLASVRYFDLRWDVEGGYVAVGDLQEDQSPMAKEEP